MFIAVFLGVVKIEGLIGPGPQRGSIDQGPCFVLFPRVARSTLQFLRLAEPYFDPSIRQQKLMTNLEPKTK